MTILLQNEKQFRVDAMQQTSRGSSESGHGHADLKSLRKLRERLREIVVSCRTIEQLPNLVAAALNLIQPCHACWIDFANAKASQNGLTLPDPLQDVSEKIIAIVPALAAKARTSGSICNQLIDSQRPFSVWAVPLLGEKEKADILFVISSTSEIAGDLWQSALLTAADLVTVWKQSRIQATVQNQTRNLAESFNLIQAICQADNVGTASRAVANHLRRIYSADMVAVSLRSGSSGDFLLSAISDVDIIDGTADLTRFAELACREAGKSNDFLLYPPLNNSQCEDEIDSAPTSKPQPLPLQQLTRAVPSEAAIGAQLRNSANEVIGTVVMTARSSLHNEQLLTQLGQMMPMVATHLERTIHATRNPVQQLAAKARHLCKSNFLRIALGALALSAAILCIPMPYKVSCDCQLQPVIRRYVPAPFDGVLDAAAVKPGDVVKKDQILATLDGRQLRIEQAALQAEISREIKRRDAALASNDIAESQIATHELSRLQSQMDQLQQRLANLTIRSPIDGIVVTGDLSQVEGAPLKTGQNLFEIAPLEQMVVEVAIPESEIRFVRQSMTVDLKLDAFPHRTWTASIARINPTTEIVEDQSVFIAEINLPNELAQLRPGMKGSANVHAHYSPLGWNLFHRWWDNVRIWAVW